MAKETLTLDPLDAPAATNLATNPAGANAKKFTDGPDFAVTREISGTGGVRSFPRAGLYRDKHAFDGSGSDTNGGTIPYTFAAAGTYVVSIYVWLPSNWSGGNLSIGTDGSYAGATVTTLASSNPGLVDQWQRISTRVTVVAGDLVGFFILRAASMPSSAATGVFYTAAVQIEAGATPSAYFDGDSEGDTPVTGYRWTGTPHASTSERYHTRTELDLHDQAAGIVVRPEGPDWGDHEVAPYMAEGEFGDVPVDFRQGNRRVTLPLLLFGGATFDDARNRLQQKVGLLQSEGGWLRRTYRDGRVLYLTVVGASLGMGGGTGQALRDIDHEVDLVLDTLPEWVGAEEAYDAMTGTGAVVGKLKVDGDDAVIPGSGPARTRSVVRDTSGNDQLGALWAFRSRYYDAASTAVVEYEAEALDPLDAAAVATVSGASGGGSNNVVEHTNLGTIWTPVLGTNIGGTTWLTHVGSYRVWARVRSPQGASVDLRFLYDVGDLTLPEENDPWTIPATDEWFLADLGEIRLDRAPHGTHRWRGQIQARGADGGEAVVVDRLWLQPVGENAGRVIAPQLLTSGLSDFLARDDFKQLGFGALHGRPAPLGGTWATSGAATDFTFADAPAATDETVTRATTNQGDFRYALLGASPANDYAAVEVEAKLWFSALHFATDLGVVARWVDADNHVRAHIHGTSPDATLFLTRKSGAGEFEIGESPPDFTLAPSTWYTIRLVVFASGRAIATLSTAAGAVVASTQGSHPALATGGALASGRVGLLDRNNSNNAATRYYDDFYARVAVGDAVVFASRSAMLRTEGMFRLDEAGAAPGPISRVIGDVPRLPPSGLEERPVELFVKPTRGDLDTLPDTALDTLGVQVFARPSYLFAPES
jgi:hypothetical protein